MKAKDLTAGETYVVSSANNWMDYPSSADRRVLLAATPFLYAEPRRWDRDGMPTRTVADLAPTADALYLAVEAVKGTRVHDTWKSAGTRLYPETTGALMVKVDENGNPTGPAHVVPLRDIRDTYEDGMAAVREASRARVAAQRATAARERDRQERFDAARESTGAGPFDVRFYDADVKMSLTEYERIAALAAQALAAQAAAS